MNSDPDVQIPLLSFGFRPFFLLAGIYAVLAMAAWIAWLALHNANAVILKPTIAVAPHLWHGHEMLFGFTIAVISGFMLTAVPGWTGARRVAGLSLAILCATWLAGRVVVWFSSFLPALFVAAVDMAYLPVLAGTIALSLLKRPMARNLIFLALLGVLIIANGAVHGEWTGLTEETASWGLAVALLTIILLIVILGGRIIPSFTRNAMTRRGESGGFPRSFAALDAASIVSVLATLASYIFALPDQLTGSAALMAGLSNLARLAFWGWRSTLSEPILWSLHLAYLSVAAGLTMVAAALLTDWLSLGAALHILAIGAIGGMTLAMMSRAPLGHTGRPLKVAPVIATAYVLVAGAAVLRGFALDAFAAHYFTVIFIAGALWIAGFTVFAIVYAPILIGPSLKP